MTNRKKLAKLNPQTCGGTALGVMADLYATLPDAAAESWLEDSRVSGKAGEMRDPWDSGSLSVLPRHGQSPDFCG